ncbi:MAG: GNAT family N-acetyltransferase [Phycisphaerales bacterium]|nr:GNAT family N-acetyltransferase [Phycisphaerales bacterium]MCI0630355.1 GNAT family N-acetyltransferase [Phycisphaerales bacterium]MCI0676387.1 GNAT family N-acetyltransferase [Phycisphaerales bacterium]
MHVRAVQPDDLPFIREELIRHWGDVGVWSIGRRYQADELPGFVAVDDSRAGDGGERIGLVTYCVQDGGYQAEIVTLSSRRENNGVGTALLDAAVEAIRKSGCVRAYLCTTNDNLRALGFYQKRGWRLAMLHKGFIEEARKRKAVIPEFGMHGIRLRDEIELEIFLDTA